MQSRSRLNLRSLLFPFLVPRCNTISQQHTFQSKACHDLESGSCVNSKPLPYWALPASAVGEVSRDGPLTRLPSANRLLEGEKQKSRCYAQGRGWASPCTRGLSSSKELLHFGTRRRDYVQPRVCAQEEWWRGRVWIGTSRQCRLPRATSQDTLRNVALTTELIGALDSDSKACRVVGATLLPGVSLTVIALCYTFRESGAQVEVLPNSFNILFLLE